MSLQPHPRQEQPPAADADYVKSLDRHGYLFGRKLTHSLSPLLHQTIYDALNLRWEQLRLDSDNITSFMRLIRDPAFYGASVTMPNKVAILPHLDELTPECRDVGACNTVFVRPHPSGDPARRLYVGANTDAAGVRESLLRNVPSPERALFGRPALVMGGGGAARSAVYALRTWLRVGDVYLVNRDGDEVCALVDECAARGYGEGLVHVTSVEQARALEAPGAVVACVPNLAPRTAGEKVARAVLVEFLRKGAAGGDGVSGKGALLEMCYNPTPFTEIGAIAEKEGWQVILGTEALIWQGLEQDKYWTGKDISELPVSKVQEVIASKVTQQPKL